jgi:hypothetical protein
VNVVTAVIFLHILSAATWLGAAMWTPGDLRRTLALGRPHVDALLARARPALRLDLAAGVLTLITGIVAMGLRGGVPRIGILVGLAAVLARLALSLAVVRPAFAGVERAVGAGDLAAAAAPAGRLAAISGIGHLLWVVALAGMVLVR